MYLIWTGECIIDIKIVYIDDVVLAGFTSSISVIVAKVWIIQRCVGTYLRKKRTFFLIYVKTYKRYALLCTNQWYNPYMVPNDHKSWTRSTSCDLWDHPWRWTWSRSGSLQFGRILFGKIWSPLHRDSKRLQHCPMWLGKYHLQMGKVDLVSELLK